MPANGSYNLFISFWFETQICLRFYCDSPPISRNSLIVPFYLSALAFANSLTMFSRLISNEGGIFLPFLD